MEKYVPLVTKQCVRKILPDEIVYNEESTQDYAGDG